MLRLMLDAHPDLAIPPETHFVPDLIDAIDGGASPEQAVETMTAVRQWGDLDTEPADVVARWQRLDPFAAGPALRCFYEIYAERRSKPRYGEKTPAYVKNMRKIERALPEARFIHVIRDGRDVALSRWKRTLGDKDPAPASQVAEGWQRRIRRAQKQGSKLQHYLELRYEDLVTDTEPNLRKIAGFLELEWDPGMLTYYEHAAERMAEMARDLPATDGKPTRPGEERMQAHAMTQKPPDPSAMYRWKEKMSATDVAAFDAAAGELLSELGYEVGAGVPGAGGRMSEPKFIALTPELHDYVVRHGAREDEALAGVRERTAALGDIAVMQISPDQGALMTMLTRLAGAERALELGTFTGYSAICIARGLAPGGTLFACELDPDRAATAEANFAAAGVADRIEVLLGPAGETLERLIGAGSEPFDLAFIDADKVGYPDYYEACLELLRPGGLIILDNMLRGGDVLDPAPEDESAQVIVALNERIAGDERVDVAMLAVADGITLARKR